MPASPCRTYTDPKAKAAWENLNRAEDQLESILSEMETTAQVHGMGYFIAADRRLMCAPLKQDGSIETEQGMHRDDYEGLSEDEMMNIARGVRDWIQRMPNADRMSAASYESDLRWNGFEVISTGGGFTAWCRTLPGGHYVLVTNANDGHTFQSDSDVTIVAAYDGDSQQIGKEWEGPLIKAHYAIAMQSWNARDKALATIDKEAIIENALNAAVKTIQDALGVKTGDTAGVFFSGAIDAQVRLPLREYMNLELDLMDANFESAAESTSNNRQTPRG